MRGSWAWKALCILFCIALSLGFSASASREPARVLEEKQTEVELALRIRRYEEGPVIVSERAGGADVEAAAFERPFYLALAFGALYLVCEGVAGRGGRKKKT